MERWLDQQSLGDFLSSEYYYGRVSATCPPAAVGVVWSWWFAGGSWEGTIPLVTVALDGPDGPRLDVFAERPGKLRPGTMLPYFPATGGGRAEAAVELAPDRIARAIAGERLRRGLYDATQHALVTGRAPVIAEVGVPWPTGRVWAGCVELVVTATHAGRTVRCAGFVRPEEATEVRLLRRAPVTVSADGSTGVLGPFPW